MEKAQHTKQDHSLTGHNILLRLSADLAYEFMSTIKEFLRFWTEWELQFFLPPNV